jgi:blue copper oxidase
MMRREAAIRDRIRDRQLAAMSRRRFMGLGAGAAAFMTLGGFQILAACDAAPPGTNPGRNPLKRPQGLVADGPTLTAAPASVDIGGGLSTTAHTYNGAFPGPSLLAVQGHPASFTLVNQLTEPTTIHSHGLVIPTAVDGQPMHAVDPGESFEYAFDVTQRASLSFYHPHPHHLTGKQVNLGLAGAFIIRDEEERALGLPSGFREVPLVLRDAVFDSAGDLTYKAQNTGYLGDTPLVNGTVDPSLGVDTALHRLRVLNGSNARVMRLALSNGAPFVLIGNDGGLLASPVEVDEITVSMAERLDLIVDFRDFAIGQTVTLRDLNSGWDLLEFEATREVTDNKVIPSGTLSSIASLGQPVRTRDFSFEGHSKINGQRFEMHHTNFTVPFGETEHWRFASAGSAPHPVHVHGTHFQVQSRSGGRNRTYPWEAGWKDTVLLEDHETVDVLVRFDQHRGEYLIHCHQLEHEDNGMMLQFEVV